MQRSPRSSSPSPYQMRHPQTKAMNSRKILMPLVLFAVVVAAGCDSGNAVNSNGESTDTALPKLDFHKPKTLVAAVQRLRTIHESAVGDEEMPKPRHFKIKEVIHGTGAGAYRGQND